MAEKSQCAHFVAGSTMRHVMDMTLTSAIGIMALFLVDLIDLFFLSLLKQTAVTAAIGYAGTIVLFAISVGIGSSIAASVLVAKNVGSGDIDRARDFATNALIFSLVISAFASIAVACASGSFLSILGAEGETKRLSQTFIWTMIPGYILIGGELSCAAILRAIGDARRAMYLTLASAIVTLCADPIFIFSFDLGIQGAAIATVLGYLASFSIGVYGVTRLHNFLNPINFDRLKRDLPSIWMIAYPGVLSQMTLPFATAYLTHLIATYGDAAVAGFAIVCRIIPVAYGIIFALASAIGPIIGQNYGGGHLNRVRDTLRDGLIFSSIYTLSVSLALFLFRHEIVSLFGATGRTSDIILFFCTFIAISWAFVGAQYLASAAFNNLGYPKISLAFNWGKATLGTVPFALLGAKLGGAEGMLVGNAVGAVIFGVAAIVSAYWVINHSEIR
mgnify:CR=1 FL=1